MSITATEAAVKWGITPRAVRALIQRGRIQGAELVIRDGRTTWIMPDQPKPPALPPGPKPKA